MPIAGPDGATLAPPLAGSRTAVQGDAIVRVMLNGLAGPIDGKTYEAAMVPMATNNDQWIADVASYIRKAFGNSGKLVDKKEVAALRKELGKRVTPWTIEELRALYPQPLTNRAAWKLTASHNDVFRTVASHHGQDFVEAHFLALRLPGGIGRVAPAATQVAAGRANERRRHAH